MGGVESERVGGVHVRAEGMKCGRGSADGMSGGDGLRGGLRDVGTAALIALEVMAAGWMARRRMGNGAGALG